MDKLLWNFYIEKLQGHPSRCRSVEDSNLQSFENAISTCKQAFENKEEPVLVLGCSDGREVDLFTKRGHKDVLGITLGDINVKAAKEDYPDARVIATDITTLEKLGPSSISYFGYVYCNQTFEHFYAPFITCLEIWTVMKPNGYWYIEWPSNVREGKSELTDPITRYTSHHHPNMLTLDEASWLLERCGFETIISNNEHSNNILVVQKIPMYSLEGYGIHATVREALAYRASLGKILK